jgi:hypothetical protein
MLVFVKKRNGSNKSRGALFGLLYKSKISSSFVDSPWNLILYAKIAEPFSKSLSTIGISIYSFLEEPF